VSLLNNVTPFRQLSRAYGALLTVSDSLSALARIKAEPGQSSEICEQVRVASREVVETLDRRFERENQELARVFAEAIKPPVKGYDIYERLGLKLLLDKASSVDRALIDQGVYESEQIAFFIGSLANFMGDPNVVFLDVGAFFGLYSLLARQAGVNRVYTFEPDRHNHAQLHAQLFLNNASHEITVINKAVSSEAAKLRFWDSRDHPLGNRGGVGIVDKHFPRSSYEVEAISLDEMFDLNGHIIWIKLDVEGHEASAIRGMRNLIEKNQVVMQIEIFDENKEAVLTEIAQTNLRKVREIYPDRYYTNMTDSRFPF
jgi:FkbM family methyltransferase